MILKLWNDIDVIVICWFWRNIGGEWVLLLYVSNFGLNVCDDFFVVYIDFVWLIRCVGLKFELLV